MSRLFSIVVTTCLAGYCAFGHAQTLTPISTFGQTAPGWLAPGDYSSNNDTAGSTLRGIAYHAPSNRLILIDRAAPDGPTVRVLDGDTGQQVHTLSEGDGIITNGTFLMGMAGCDDDGNLYVCNLTTSATSNFKVYRWSSDAIQNLTTEIPTVAHGTVSGRIRTGDSFAVIGSGVNTRIVSAGGSNATDSAFTLLTTVDGLNFVASNPVVTGNDLGAYRLGIAFDGQGSVIGKQTGLPIWRAPEAGGAAASQNVTDISESIVGYDPSSNLLATVQYTGGLGAANTVRLYQWSDFGNPPVLLDTKNLTSVANGNGNGVGAIAFGYGPGEVLRMYALNTNNGIQAFEVDMSASNATVLNRSVVHGGWAGGGSAVDTGKVLHKEDANPTALNYDNLINTARGLNGVQFEVQDLANPAGLNASDFEFQMSPQGAFDEGSNPPSAWTPAPAPSSVSVTGVNPYVASITWPDNSIQNRWLRITVKANANTGLAADEVYYIGHLLGETTGDVGGIFTVAFADITPIRATVGNTVDASSTVDIDKSGTVAFADISAMRANVGAQLTAITVP